MPKPTIIDLAKAAGVSPTTISHAFSGRRKVDPKTRERIIALAEQMGYRPNQAAQQLRSGRTGTIALASSMPFAIAAGPSRLGFLMEIAASAAVTALTRNMALCLIPPLAPDSNLDRLAFDGAIVVEPCRDDPLIAHFEARRIPIVSIGKVPGRPEIPAIDLRSARAASLLLDHLHDVGSRRIGLITGATRRTSYEETEAAYADFTAAHAIPQTTLRIEESGGEPLAETEAIRLIGQHPELDGLLVLVDAFAAGALTALQRLGKQIPQNIRIATRYDGMRARLATPQLTALNLHLDQIAEMAVEMIFARVEGTELPLQPDAPTPDIVLRKSSKG